MIDRLRTLCWTALVLVSLVEFPALSQTDFQTEFRQIAQLLRLDAGTVVADVGAGGGSWSRLLADSVGSDGHVFATDVRPEVLPGILAGTRQAQNVTVVLGSQDTTGLPPQCCDAVLLRLVYHAFKKPDLMRRSLARAVRPGGRVLIIDFPGGALGVIPADLERDMTHSGFVKAGFVDGWQGQQSVYGILFRKLPLN